MYLLARTAWIGFRPDARPAPLRSRWPVWALAAATLFLVGFRVGLNVDQGGTVIDVGYAGVIGADRILDGRAPYGAMPVTDGSPPAGRPGRTGDPERIQSNGRCESANPRGDTYGPVAYLAYVPAVLALGWSGRWDELPGRHATSIAFDLLALAALALIGRRLGGSRLAATLAFGWAAYPFTAYALMSNTNDAIMPALLLLGFWLASSPIARGAATALASSTKFASLILAPLWLTYRSGLRPGQLARYAAGFGVATLAAFSCSCSSRRSSTPCATSGTGRWVPARARLALLDLGLGPVPRGIPDLGFPPDGRPGLRDRARGSRGRAPARKLKLAALTAALLLAFELTLTHWSYLYLPWVLPFVLLALTLPRARPAEAPSAVVSPAPRDATSSRAPSSSRRRWPSPSPGSCSGTRSPISRCIELRRANRERARPVPRLRVRIPPGALPALVLPALVTDSLAAYRVVFAAEMAVVGALGVLLLAEGLRALGRNGPTAGSSSPRSRSFRCCSGA